LRRRGSVADPHPGPLPTGEREKDPHPSPLSRGERGGTDWQLVFRTLITLPLAYVAYRNKNLIPSILIHALANSVEVVMGFATILSM